MTISKISAVHKSNRELRSNRFSRIFLVYFGILVLTATPEIFGEDYAWPLAEYLGCTSSFCEFRRNHFHAGLDLRTSKEGIPVIAVGDGSISRLNISATGYGKAVYVSLKDGKIAVYAHLKGFTPAIETLIRKQQKKSKRYRVNFQLASSTFPVKKGDIIAYSGSTGAGPAHLHFELRDGYNRPLNPLKNGFKVKDTRSPVFYLVYFEPMDAISHVSETEPLILNYDQRRKIYTINDPVYLEGEVGVSVSVHDYINLTQNQMSPYTLELYCDGALLHKVDYKTFSYDLTYQSDLDYNLELSNKLGRGFHNLYKASNNRLPLYTQPTGKNGLIRTIDYTPDLHQLKIVAIDATGNRAIALIPVMIGLSSIISTSQIYHNDDQWHLDFGSSIHYSDLALQVLPDPTGNWQPLTDFWWEVPARRFAFNSPFPSAQSFYLQVNLKDTWGNDYIPLYEFAEPGLQIVSSLRQDDLKMSAAVKRGFMEVQIETNPLSGIKPVTIVKESDGLWHEIELRTSEPGRFYGRFLPERKNPGVVQIESYLISANGYQVAVASQHWLSPVHKQIAQSVEFDEADRLTGLGTNIKFYFPPGSVSTDFLLSVQTDYQSNPTKVELSSDIYKIEPDYVLLDKKATLSLTPGNNIPNPEQLAIYRRRKSYWHFLSKKQNRGTFSADIRKFGSFAILRDRKPPVIHSLSPPDGQSIKNRRPLLKANVYDDLSGIHQNDIALYLDEELIFAEYDVDLNYLFYDLDKDLALGKHNLTLVVKDRVGNSKKKSNEFIIQGSKLE